jgi:hypothetical protein
MNTMLKVYRPHYSIKLNHRVTVGFVMLKYVLIVLAAVALSACSSIVDDDTQMVNVNTDPPGAKCTLQNDEGRFVVGSTPGTVMIETSCDPLMIACEKEGYQTTTSSSEDKHKGIVWGNVIFGGIVGYAVDRYSGAACKYPNDVFVTLPKK